MCVIISNNRLWPPSWEESVLWDHSKIWDLSLEFGVKADSWVITSSLHLLGHSLSCHCPPSCTASGVLARPLSQSALTTGRSPRSPRKNPKCLENAPIAPLYPSPHREPLPTSFCGGRARLLEFSIPISHNSFHHVCSGWSYKIRHPRKRKWCRH